jgi:ATP-dependent protease HslVU (ClpYQ) peptidase subunit
VRAGGKGRRPRLCKAFRALRLSAEGIFLIEGPDDTWMKIDDEFYAIGSGAHYAIGALAMGAAPKRAVEIAMDWDNFTGGKINVLGLK